LPAATEHDAPAAMTPGAQAEPNRTERCRARVDSATEKIL